MLTRALAVLGILAVPATGAAATVIALGARAIVVLTVLLFVQMAVLAVAFTVINRRS